jgi:hypothetical protein
MYSGTKKPAQNVKLKFPLGRTVTTRGAFEAFKKAGQVMAFFLMRHVLGDWGDLSEHDKNLNDEAVAYEGNPDKQDRVLSAYHLNDGTKFYVITEWDRSLTTILLPEEY